jgi:ATP-dependent DNA helicase RecQ
MAAPLRIHEPKIQCIKLELLENRYNILYVAPERIMIPDFLQFLQQLDINLIAIDEAHCISEWGHDFRPGYRQLKLLKEHFSQTPLIAITATAIPEVQKDIITQLKLANPRKYIASLNRKNLFYEVKPKDNAYYQLLQYLKNHDKDSGVIYCSSRNTVDDLANKLQKEGYRVLPYHAGLNSDLRTETQDKFVKDDVEIIVATIAFGMGIDKPNIRFVVHYDLPKNLETYYQETGRAGRDGENSDCILFYSYGDRSKIEYFIEHKEDEIEKRIAYKKLQDMINFCESRTCRRKILLKYFDENFNETNCKNCDVCQNPKETIDGTIIAQKIISCISQVNERFGMSYIAGILCGLKSKKIIANGHNTLTTYGIGKEYSKKRWQAFLRELVQLDYLKLEGGRYPIVKITPQFRDILFKQEKILLTKPNEKIQSFPQHSDENFDYDLFKILKTLRKKLADEESIPPYIIFHDSSLKAMATYFPQSLSDFLKINGVGQNKLDKYGELFVEKIVTYCKNHNIEQKQISGCRLPAKTITSTLEETLELYKQNLSIEEIAQKRNLKTSTIVSHIEKLIKLGEEISIDKFVDINKQKHIMKELSIIGSERLKPIIEKLGDNYTYEEIRLVRAYNCSNQANKWINLKVLAVTKMYDNVCVAGVDEFCSWSRLVH